MRSLLTIEVALGILLVTSFTCVGLVALWAATSRRHWFLPVAVVVGFLSPLLLIPAFGPFLCGLSAAMLIFGGIVLYRMVLSWLAKKRSVVKGHSDGRDATRMQFSVQSALGIVVIVSVLAAVATRIPIETWQELPLTAEWALLLAINTLSASWVICGES